jgi:hypothetical protein
MGAGRRQHHQQEAAKRQAGIDADRARREAEAAQARFQAQLEAQRQAMLEQTRAMREVRAPQVLQSTVGAENVGVRTRRSRRQSTRAMGSGASALRIPLNIGGGSGGGLSIG